MYIYICGTYVNDTLDTKHRALHYILYILSIMLYIVQSTFNLINLLLHTL